MQRVATGARDTAVPAVTIDHEARAEALLAQVEADRYLRADEVASLTARAGVHAQLAIAQRLAALVAR